MAYGIVTIPFSERTRNANLIQASLKSQNVAALVQVDNPKPRHNSLWNHFRMWRRLLATGKPWLTGMQDDIILTSNFVEKHLARLNEHHLESKVMSFFSMTTVRAKRALDSGARYFKYFGFSDQCATLHSGVVARMLSVFEEIFGDSIPAAYWEHFGYTKPRNLGWDSFWNMHCVEWEEEYNPIYVIPDLVQHDVDKFDSSIGNPNKGKGPGRISRTFEP